MDLQGKAAIVTGSGTGVGRSTALALAERGCDVVVNYSRSESAAEQVAALARDAGVKSMAIKADVSDDAQCRAMVAEAVDSFGRLDVLVNNAGTTSFIAHDNLEAMTAEAWEQIQLSHFLTPDRIHLFHQAPCDRGKQPWRMQWLHLHCLESR